MFGAYLVNIGSEILDARANHGLTNRHFLNPAYLCPRDPKMDITTENSKSISVLLIFDFIPVLEQR